MTVCVAVKVHDCIVFAADSAVSLTATSDNGQSLVQNVWYHGNKVFQLHKKLPIVAMTAGMGHFGPASISNLSKKLRFLLSNDLEHERYTISDVAEYAYTFFREKYEELNPTPANPHAFEFWIGGYGTNGSQGEIWKLELIGGKMESPRPIANADIDHLVTYGGQILAIHRLLHGIDQNLIQTLQEQGSITKDAERIIVEILPLFQTPLVHPTMPVQDAIDLADFLVDVTKRYFTFLPGANIVGGDTDIATVTKYEGFKWIKRKHYYSENINRQEKNYEIEKTN